MSFTREGWPLLAVEAEASGELWSTNEGCPHLWLVRCTLRSGKKDFLTCLDCSDQPSTKYFFTRRLISLYMSPSLSNLGRQSCRVACLLICVSAFTCAQLILKFAIVYSLDYYLRMTWRKWRSEQSGTSCSSTSRSPRFLSGSPTRERRRRIRSWTWRTFSSRWPIFRRDYSGRADFNTPLDSRNHG